MEIVATCKTIIWICIAACMIFITATVIVSFFQSNKKFSKRNQMLDKICEEIINELKNGNDKKEK